MRISLIGAGRVATHLARVLSTQHHIVNIFSRTLYQAENLAKVVNAQACSTFESMNENVDLIIIAVSDQSISEVIQSLHSYFSETLIVHTSGSTHLTALTQHHERSGVFYPLQTFSFEKEIDWALTPLFIEGAFEHDAELLKTLAREMSERVYQYSSEQRLSLHLAAVFACNFSNYCYDMAKQILDQKHVDFSLLHPLIRETALKATQYDPKTVQTGPAMRGDHNILAMHQEMLVHDEREDLKQVYDLLSNQIQQR